MKIWILTILLWKAFSINTWHTFGYISLVSIIIFSNPLLIEHYFTFLFLTSSVIIHVTVNMNSLFHGVTLNSYFLECFFSDNEYFFLLFLYIRHYWLILVFQ